uniref:Beta-defensin-like domain-containing protein n=1 Tax=Podarcis muralis TaxID=64176 RepID=A0A670I9V6_PODMU
LIWRKTFLSLGEFLPLSISVGFANVPDENLRCVLNGGHCNYSYCRRPMRQIGICKNGSRCCYVYC